MALIEIDWNPDAKKLRQFGAGLAVFGAALGGLAFWRGHPTLALWILAGGAALGATSLSSERAGRTIYKAWMVLAFVIGTVVSVVLLALIYYLVATPLGMLLRLKGHNPLRLREPSGSCWTALEMPEDKSYYERLF